MNKKIDFKKISVHEAPELSPGFLLWHVSTSWRSCIEDLLKPIDLTHPQFVILATLGWLTRHGNLVTQRAIGQMAGLDPNTTSQIIKGLEKKGLITRTQGSDTRAKNSLLTEKGQQILAKALPAVEKGDGEFFQLLNSQELKLLLNLFQKLAPTTR